MPVQIFSVNTLSIGTDRLEQTQIRMLQNVASDLGLFATY